METRKDFFRLVMAVVVLTAASAVLADWDPGDPYKMHWPQLPKRGGLDVEFGASTLADDWKCTESGPVSDIHLWVSWMDDKVQRIPLINVAIYSDIPSVPGQIPYSRPGKLLWEQTFLDGQFKVRDMTPDLQDWFDPSQKWPFNYGAQNHKLWQQINIDPIKKPFTQKEGEIYWLAVNFGQLPYIGWKESGSRHFNDDAVWQSPTGGWVELQYPNPDLAYSLDLAFVITPEPTTIALLAIGGLLARKRF